MNNRKYISTGLFFVLIFTLEVSAQQSSIGSKVRQENRNNRVKNLSREAPPQPGNAVYEKHSWISVRPPKPKTFAPGDLLTIIIRETRQWKANSDLKTKKEFDLTSDLSAFLKLTQGGVGASVFRRGVPRIDYKLEQELKGKGDALRRDTLTTRLTAKIIDVKPNGLLVFEGKASITHDDEVSIVTITGMCRKEDVTVDNTILSTQVANKVVTVDNQGALRKVSSRGWLLKILDYMSPF